MPKQDSNILAKKKKKRELLGWNFSTVAAAADLCAAKTRPLGLVLRRLPSLLGASGSARAFVCVCVCVCVRARVSQSCPSLCNPWCTVTHQVSLSMEFSRQEHWSGLPCSSPSIQINYSFIRITIIRLLCIPVHNSPLSLDEGHHLRVNRLY